VLAWAARYTTPAPVGAVASAIAFALAQLGKPYQWGATGPDAFDCSGLAMMAYRAAGLTIPRTSQAQWAHGKHIPASQARPGDLVFFAGADGTLTAPGHVGIIIGNGYMIDAPTTGMTIQIQPYTGQPDLAGFTEPAVSGRTCRFSIKMSFSQKTCPGLVRSDMSLRQGGPVSVDAADSHCACR